MRVELSEHHSRGSWDAFVADRPGCWHYQLFGWKDVIERTYGHSCFYLRAVQGDEVVGLLPLANIESRLFGRSITSLPFLDTAGVEALDSSGRDALISRARDLCGERSSHYLELRQAQLLPGEFSVDTRKVSLTMALRDSVDKQWDSLSSERRNRVRKAQKAGLSAEIGGASLLPEFYRVWSRNMRDLGSPAHSRRWFEEVLSVFADTASIILIRSQHRAVGAALMIHYKGILAVPWVSSLREAFEKHPNDLLYWESIRSAQERGCGHFDFGRSTAGSGNYTYKVRWGATASPIFWHYAARGEAAPRLPESDEPRYRLATWLWKRLPVSVANLVGPRIRKGITR
jgi:serine/alanine adding enzyme